MLNDQDVKSVLLMQAARAGRVRQGEARQRRAADPAAAARHCSSSSRAGPVQFFSLSGSAHERVPLQFARLNKFKK